jgi:ribonuclease Z
LCYAFVACHEVREDRWAPPARDEAAAGAAAAAKVYYDAQDLNLVRAACEEMGLARVVSAPVVHCAQSYAVSVEAKPRPPPGLAEGGGGEREAEEDARGGARTTTPPDDDDGDVVPGWKLVYSGDTRPCESLTRLAKDATVLVHEATFENDMEEDAIKKRHSTTREAVKTGVDARAYRTILTHFSQRYPKIPVLDGSASERTAVAFDMMRVDFARDLPRLPSLVPAVQAIFLDPEEVFGGRKNANKKKNAQQPPRRGGSKSPPRR